MSDDSVKLIGFGSLAKKLKENNVNASEEELSSLFDETISNAKDNKISANDYANALLEAYKIDNNSDILNTLSQIASNDGTDGDLSAKDFEIQNTIGQNQYANNLSVEDKTKICEKLQAQIKNIENQLDETIDNQGWLSKGLSKINNLFGFGTSEKEARAKIEEYQKLISELDPNDSNFADKYKAITGEDLNKENTGSLLFDSDSYIEEYKKQYEAQYGTSLTNEQISNLKDYIENESNVNKLSNAMEVIYDYENTQSSAKEITIGIATGLTTAAAVIAAPFTGGASIALGAAVGGATKLALEGTDAIGTTHKYTLEEGILDFASGSLDGAITALTLGGANLAGKGLKTIFNSASKTMIENQTIANAKNLVTSSGKSIAKQAFAGFAKSTARAVGIAEISTIGRYTIDTVGKSALYDATGNYTVSDSPSQIIQNEDGTYSLYYTVVDSNNGDNIFYQIETVDSYSQDENGNYVKGNILSTSQSNDFNGVDLGKQMMTSAIAATTGSVIGRVTNNIVNPTFTALSNSTVIGNIAEMTTDGALSLGADYLMASAQQGHFVDGSEFFSWDRILGEGRNQIRGLLIGIASSKSNASTSIIEQEASRLIQSGDEAAAREFLQENGYRTKNIDNFVENTNKQVTVNNACAAYLNEDEESARATLKNQGYSEKQIDVMFSNAKAQNAVIQAQIKLSQGDIDGAEKIMQENGISQKEINNIIQDNQRQQIIQQANDKILNGDTQGAQSLLKENGFSALQIKVALSDATVQKNIQDAYNLALLGGSENIEQARKTLEQNGLKNDEIETILSNAKTQKIIQDLYAVQQDDSSTCAVVSVLNAINSKPMLAQALMNEFEYDQTSDTYKFSMFGEDFEVKLNEGENLLQKVYDAYEITYGKDVTGDFISRVYSEILGDANDIIVKPTADNLETLKTYSEDENSILTFNTSDDVEGLLKNHSYAVMGIDENGNIKLQDPLTLEEITISKAQYENINCQIEGKTLSDDGIVDDGVKARMVGDEIKSERSIKPKTKNKLNTKEFFECKEVQAIKKDYDEQVEHLIEQLDSIINVYDCAKYFDNAIIAEKMESLYEATNKGPEATLIKKFEVLSAYIVEYGTPELTSKIKSVQEEYNKIQTEYMDKTLLVYVDSVKNLIDKDRPNINEIIEDITKRYNIPKEDTKVLIEGMTRLAGYSDFNKLAEYIKNEDAILIVPDNASLGQAVAYMFQKLGISDVKILYADEKTDEDGNTEYHSYEYQKGEPIDRYSKDKKYIILNANEKKLPDNVINLNFGNMSEGCNIFNGTTDSEILTRFDKIFEEYSGDIEKIKSLYSENKIFATQGEVEDILNKRFSNRANGNAEAFIEEFKKYYAGQNYTSEEINSYLSFLINSVQIYNENDIINSLTEIINTVGNNATFIMNKTSMNGGAGGKAAKSQHMLAYMISLIYQRNGKKTDIREIPEGCKIKNEAPDAHKIVYIDDFAGSGDSLADVIGYMAKDKKNQKTPVALNEDQELIIAPLYITQTGKTRLITYISELTSKAGTARISLYPNSTEVSSLNIDSNGYSTKGENIRNMYGIINEIRNRLDTSSFVKLDFSSKDIKPNDYYKYIKEEYNKYASSDERLYIYQIVKKTNKQGEPIEYEYYASKIPPYIAENAITGFKGGSTGLSEFYMSPNNNTTLFNLLLSCLYGDYGIMVKYHGDKTDKELYSCKWVSSEIE